VLQHEAINIPHYISTAFAIDFSNKLFIKSYDLYEYFKLFPATPGARAPGAHNTEISSLVV
jgi:hypothetical protein